MHIIYVHQGVCVCISQCASVHVCVCYVYPCVWHAWWDIWHVCTKLAEVISFYWFNHKQHNYDSTNLFLYYIQYELQQFYCLILTDHQKVIDMWEFNKMYVIHICYVPKWNLQITSLNAQVLTGLTLALRRKASPPILQSKLVSTGVLTLTLCTGILFQ